MIYWNKFLRTFGYAIDKVISRQIGKLFQWIKSRPLWKFKITNEYLPNTRKRSLLIRFPIHKFAYFSLVKVGYL